MIQVAPNYFLVTKVSELPNLHGEVLYLDYETTSKSKTKNSLNPWMHCWIAGIAIKSDKQKECFYIPIGHNEKMFKRWNLPEEEVKKWLFHTISRFPRWANANVKYDMLVQYTNFGWRVSNEMSTECLTVLAKLVETDREYKGGYSEEKLAEWLLNENPANLKHELKDYLKRIKSEDYGDYPPDKMAVYACADVDYAQRIHRELLRRLPEEVKPVWNTEKDLTHVLFDMEVQGMRIDPQQVTMKAVETLTQILVNENKIKDLTGSFINVSSSTQMYDYLCNRLGLPVLHWTNEDDDEKQSNPSFSEDSLKDYYSLVNAPTEFLDIAIQQRSLKTFDGLFLQKWAELNIDGYLHPIFNQCVRTGRLSCSSPNLMQLNKHAKFLILPPPGYSIARWDYSGIEYRFIVHYIKNISAIEEFNRNPDADFHLMISKMISEVKTDEFFHKLRSVAKTLNFQNAYGAGVKKMISAIAAQKVIVDSIREQLESIEVYRNLPEAKKIEKLQERVVSKAKEHYRNYHINLPTLRLTTKLAQSRCKERGYAFNLFGRRRHIPADMARIAFNAMNQGSAADLAKIKMVETWKMCQGTPIKLTVQVHDELAYVAPTEITDDPRFVRDMTDVLEESPIKLRVPIRTKHGISANSWGEASSDAFEKSFPYDQRGTGERLEWLK